MTARVSSLILNNGQQMPVIGLGTWKVCLPYIFYHIGCAFYSYNYSILCSREQMLYRTLALPWLKPVH